MEPLLRESCFAGRKRMLPPEVSEIPFLCYPSL